MPWGLAGAALGNLSLPIPSPAPPLLLVALCFSLLPSLQESSSLRGFAAPLPRQPSPAQPRARAPLSTLLPDASSFTTSLEYDYSAPWVRAREICAEMTFWLYMMLLKYDKNAININNPFHCII